MEDLYIIIFFYLVGLSVATVYQMPKALECCRCQDVQTVKNLTKYDADYLDHDTSLKCIMQHPRFPLYVWMCGCYV